jgi:hypothetical protein
MKTSMKNIFFALGLGVVFFSCDEPIKLDLDQTPPTIVIEGLVTNRTGRQSVKVTMTNDFYSPDKNPRVTDAVVTVTDDLGNEYLFEHNPRNVTDSAGIYIPQDKTFVGVIGQKYTLNVEVDGKTYSGSDELVSVIPMDSLNYRLNENEREDPKDFGRFYEVLLYAREPQDQTNYYLFKFYRNDSLKYYNDTDVYFSDDRFLGENIDGIETPIFYKPGDVARVEAYSISRSGYIFYYDLNSILNNDAGGMFGPVPASPRNNLSNGALGFFQVSALNSATITLE